jgi:hypothetical protein
MKRLVFCYRSTKDQILRAIIRVVFVHMVYLLFGLHMPPDHVLRHKPVLIDISAHIRIRVVWLLNQNIAARVYCSATMPVRISL